MDSAQAEQFPARGTLAAHLPMTRLHRRPVSHPRGELRYSVRVERGQVTAFVVQLYCWRDGSWHLVAQFDHTPKTSEGHDVTVEGVHMDVFRDGEKYEVETSPHPGPSAPELALDYAIRYLETYNERLIEQYDAWLSE